MAHLKPEEKTDIKGLAELKFDEKGLIPAIVQDNETGEVLMVAYMNEESLKKTLTIKKTCFWSRSRSQFWVKGETSGHFQFVKGIWYDCDKDAILIKVRQVGAACHTGKRSCFYRKLKLK
ncbi:MAG: phosphoribosyl-AMP cyclohydrolase [Candidatus Omnitrophota bacterium]